MYVVAGATGQTGSAVAEWLLEHGQPVTVIVRSEEKGQPWRSRGAETAIGSLEDSDTLTRTLANAEGAYLLIPPSYTSGDFVTGQRRVADALRRAVVDSGVPHVVFLSSVGAHLDSGTGPILGLHYAEAVLTPLSRNLTILRPAYFLENWAPVLGFAKDSGVLPSFLTPNRKIPMIATEDIGRIAAECLVTPSTGRRIIELAGPEDYCPDDIAAILASLLDRDVHVQPVPLSAAVSTFTSAGFSPEAAKLFEEMYAGLNSGHIVYEQEGAEFREGTVNAADVLKGLLGRSGTARASA
ncbi:MAG: NmrA family NAD(P)-binding protein [Bryobacteraceae bacterium]